MRYYRFKTFVTSYFFPDMDKETQFLYFLYGNYGSWKAKLYWWGFRHSKLVRMANSIDSSEIENYDSIKRLSGEDASIAINYGTPNQEQKKSIIGLNRKSGKRFFAKYAVKKDAMALTRHEINIYEMLSKTGLVPQIYSYDIKPDYVYLKCEYVEGTHIHEDIDEERLLSFLYILRTIHYPKPDEWSRWHGLETSFAHCDFCPWNMIDTDTGIKLIDWELAQERPLGFDLFTYVFLSNYARNHSLTNERIWSKYQNVIREYFNAANISDCRPYLKAFVDIKQAWQKERKDSFYFDKLMALKDFASNI